VQPHTVMGTPTGPTTFPAARALPLVIVACVCITAAAAAVEQPMLEAAPELPLDGPEWVAETEQTLRRLQALLTAKAASLHRQQKGEESLGLQGGVHHNPAARTLAGFSDTDESLQRLLDSVLANANALRSEEVARAGAGGSALPPSFGVDEHLRGVESYPAVMNEGLATGISEPKAVGSPRTEWATAAQAAPLSYTPTEFQTTYKCYRSVDWAEICVYNNLCHDGSMVVFFDDSRSDNKTLIPRCVRGAGAGRGPLLPLPPAPPAIVRPTPPGPPTHNRKGPQVITLCHRVNFPFASQAFPNRGQRRRPPHVRRVPATAACEQGSSQQRAGQRILPS
jgi:hypothetical protein